MNSPALRQELAQVQTPTKERPILFSGAMVRAILEGRKTQTRRACKGAALRMLNDGFTPEYVADPGNADLNPYGQPGDRLWVREIWAMNIPPSGPIYRADAEAHNGIPDRWRPSIFMPRKFSRLTLEITKIRVERVQDISESDAIAEGVDAVSMADVPRQATMSRRSDFAQLWNRINAKRGFGWEVNPWVWVIEFRRAA